MGSSLVLYIVNYKIWIIYFIFGILVWGDVFYSIIYNNLKFGIYMYIKIVE